MPPRLKSLELHGYKTFASRTNFAFPGIITAIVGPNGSGKSNIADALRWVLGEQSYTLLRGRKTEDMIFSGSEQRSRAGMASATINFDNEDGWLPIDFSEVAITRRAYRDGQNEYLINGQRVRLREISELLAQSGLAERTYTIIGQGLVDAALSLKPEERRRLFEEAAGIGLYRSRREEALNRLDSTNRNLERVQDIIAELEPRLKSLERQAKRAQEYENLRSDLHILLRDWYGFHWLESQKELKRSSEIFRQQEKRLEQVRGQRTAVNEEMIDLRHQINEARSELNIRHSYSASLHQQLEQTSRSLAILDERKRSLQELGQSLQLDLSRLEGEIEDRKNRLDLALTEKDRLSEELTETQKQATAAQQAFQLRQKERLEVENTLAARRQNLIQVESRVVKQTARKNELDERLLGIKNSLAGTEQAIQSSQQELDKLKSQADAISLEKNKAESEQKAAAEFVQTQRAELQTLEARRQERQLERSRNEAECTRLRAQLDVLDQAQKSFSGLGDGAKFILETRRLGKIKGDVQSISSLMDVPTELETAVTAALGEYLDMVLLENNTDPDQVLEMLQTSDKGRAAILPAAWARSPGQLKEINDAECLGLAANLVGCSPDKRSFIEAALGQMYIVSSRSAARRVLADQPPSARAVTLNGEVFLTNGAVISGRQAKSGSAQFSRPRQIRDLQAALSNLEKTGDLYLNQLQALDKDVTQAKDNQKVLDQNLHKAEGAIAAIVNRLRSTEMNIEQNRRQVEWLRKQHSQSQNQVSSLEKEISSADESIQLDGKEIEKIKIAVQAFAANLAGLPLDEYRAQSAHWDTSSAVTRRAFSEAEKRLVEIQNDLAAATNNVTSINGRIQTCSENILTIETERTQLHQEESRLRIEVDETSRMAVPQEETLQRLETALEELQSSDIATQQALTMAERHYTQAQLDAVKARETAETIHRRAEEDFGLVSFDVEEAEAAQQPLPLEGMVEELPALETLPAGLEENISRLRAQLRRMGAVNPDALSEFNEVHDRCHSLKRRWLICTKRVKISIR